MIAGEQLIAQISDTHIGGLMVDGDDVNLARLDRVLDHLCAMRRRPDILLVTGDLAGRDGTAPYQALRQRLDRCPIPVHVCLGNHDSRDEARQVFQGGDAVFLHYALDAGPLRLIVLDTLEEGRHGGAFCEARAAWLRDRLAEAPDRPTLVALHHPPIDTGIDWLTTDPAEPWIARLDQALAGQRQVIALLAGHIHRPIAASRNGIAVRICPSVAAPLTLDLAPLDPQKPDGRTLVADGPPGYALHLWRNGVLTTHFDFVQAQPMLARFDRQMQPHIQAMFAERP
ncbi:MAG TPA: metallophosphoesterase [Allosphingosinicella sp.]|nr:metallophosphoesterase [Allosphingosinicella sp.]